MGLDMYLRRGSYKYRLGDGTLITGRGMKFEDYYKSDEFGCSNGVEITETIGYWRKANAIHNWFVKNVQDGNDNCQTSYVTMEKLKELYELCNSIIDKVDGAKISTKSGEESIFTKSMCDDLSWRDLCSFNFELTDEVKDFIMETLPPCSGFFFGSTDIDGGYFYDIIKTIVMLNRLFKDDEKANNNKEYYDYYYEASW